MSASINPTGPESRPMQYQPKLLRPFFLATFEHVEASQNQIARKNTKATKTGTWLLARSLRHCESGLGKY